MRVQPAQEIPQPGDAVAETDRVYEPARTRPGGIAVEERHRGRAVAAENHQRMPRRCPAAFEIQRQPGIAQRRGQVRRFLLDGQAYGHHVEIAGCALAAGGQPERHAVLLHPRGVGRGREKGQIGIDARDGLRDGQQETVGDGCLDVVVARQAADQDPQARGFEARGIGPAGLVARQPQAAARQPRPPRRKPRRIRCNTRLHGRLKSGRTSRKARKKDRARRSQIAPERARQVTGTHAQ